MSARVEACVLAAGRGRRMGFAKHLYELEGVALLARVVRALQAAKLTPIRVVLRAGDAEGLELVRKLGVGASFADGDEGRAASVRTAVRSTSPDAAGLLIALADQPFLEPGDFAALVAEFGRVTQGIVRARYDAEPGTPVIFSRAYFPELLQLRGEDGGSKVIGAHADAVRFIDLPKERGRDLDQPEDLPVRR